MKIGILALLWCTAALPFAAGAQQDDTTADTASQQVALTEFVEALPFRDGEIAVAAAGARFRLDPDFRFLEQQDARRVLEDLWGNPPDTSVLGMIVPRSPDLTQPEAWAVVVTFNDEGHVSDADAGSIDYDALLTTMQASIAEANEFRRREGYPALQLQGWAEPPHYDASARKLHWARELAFEGSAEATLNYDIRVLGRHGYLSLNAVSGMGELGQVREGMQRLIGMTGFDEGHRYADYNASTDKLASYGLAALIGGTLAAKSGLLAKLIGVLIAAKKIAIPLLIGAIALVYRLVGRRKTGERTP